MKKIFVFILSVLFVACESDDIQNPEIGNSERIVGKWEVVQTGVRVDGVEQLNDAVILCGGRSAIYEYKADGTFVITTSHINEVSVCEIHTSTGTWTIFNDVLISLYDGITDAYPEDILLLNDSTLKTFSSPNSVINVLRRITGNELLIEGKWKLIQTAQAYSESEEPQFSDYINDCGFWTREFNINGSYHEQNNVRNGAGDCITNNYYNYWKVIDNHIHIIFSPYPPEEILFLDETTLKTKHVILVNDGTNPSFYLYTYGIYIRM